MWSGLSNAQRCVWLATVIAACLAGFVYIPYRIPTDHSIRYGWAWSPVSYEDPLLERLLSTLDIEKLAHEVPIDKERFARSHIRPGERSSIHALRNVAILVTVGIAGMWLIGLLQGRRFPPTLGAGDEKRLVRFVLLANLLFVFLLGAYERNDASWGSSEGSVTAQRVRAGVPFFCLSYVSLQPKGSIHGFEDFPDAQDYPLGLRIIFPDLILDGFFVLMITILLKAVTGWAGAFARSKRGPLAIRLAAVGCFAALLGAGAPLLAPTKLIAIGMFAAPALIVAVIFWTTRAYLPMILGDAVSVLGLWWGVRIGTLAETHAGRVELEELAAVGLAFAAYLLVLLPVAAASRFCDGTRSSLPRPGQIPHLTASNDQPQSPPATDQPGG